MNKVLHGDCMELMRDIPDDSIDCIVTSPPYNRGRWNQVKRRRAADAWRNATIDYAGFGDDLDPADYERQQTAMLAEMVRVLKPRGSIFYNHKPLIHRHALVYPLWVFGFNVRQQIVWDRGSTPSIGPIRWLPTTEYVFWITKTATQPKYRHQGKHRTEVWRIPPARDREHPATFPAELVEQCLLSTTDEGDVVLDPYAGSGTVLLAARRHGRRFIGMEISRAYIDVINWRLGSHGDE